MNTRVIFLSPVHIRRGSSVLIGIRKSDDGSQYFMVTYYDLIPCKPGKMFSGQPKDYNGRLSTSISNVLYLALEQESISNHKKYKLKAQE